MNYKARVLTIAGSDSGGGAGIQADLKTFHSFDVFGMSALTSVTAQNTMGVSAVHDVPPEIVRAQIDAVMEDIGVDAVKTGMLSSKAIIAAVVDRIRRYEMRQLVVDPVMVAKGGDRLLHRDAESALIRELLPVAFLVTPNVPEAELISGMRIQNGQDAKQAAKIIQAKGPRFVLLKGGQLREPQAVDILFDGQAYHEFKAPRWPSSHTHGTGCTFSAAIAAGLAKGFDVYDSIRSAKDYVTRAIQNAPDNIGKGTGPLYHRIEPVGPSAFEETPEDFDAGLARTRKSSNRSCGR